MTEEVATMQYLLMLDFRRGEGPQEGTPEFDVQMEQWTKFNEEARAAGVAIGASSYQSRSAPSAPGFHRHVPVHASPPVARCGLREPYSTARSTCGELDKRTTLPSPCQSRRPACGARSRDLPSPDRSLAPSCSPSRFTAWEGITAT
jgi:hypothetical protein